MYSYYLSAYTWHVIYRPILELERNGFNYLKNPLCLSTSLLINLIKLQKKEKGVNEINQAISINHLLILLYFQRKVIDSFFARIYFPLDIEDTIPPPRQEWFRNKIL